LEWTRIEADVSSPKRAHKFHTLCVAENGKAYVYGPRKDFWVNDIFVLDIRKSHLSIGPGIGHISI
jgi:hypothetical protein